MRRQLRQSKDRGLFAESTWQSMEGQMDVLAALHWFLWLGSNIFQQVAHNEECRERTKKRFADEVGEKRLELKRLRQEDN